MFTTTGFYRLTYAQQADMLGHQGLFMETRREGNFLVDLYELDDLLIEVFYQKDSEEPVSVMAFEAAKKLKRLYADSLQPRLTIKRDRFHKSNYAA